jgi:predicted Kef-type K+ transport protein
MLLNPGALIESPGLTAGALVIVLVGKPLVALAIVWIMRYPLKVALTVASGPGLGPFGCGTRLGARLSGRHHWIWSNR